MNYFRIRRYRSFFEKFEELAYEYWSKLPNQPNTYGMVKFKYVDNDESREVRGRIVQLLPYIEEGAQYLGIGYIAQSYPAPAVGGPILHVNIYRSVIEPEQGHEVLDDGLIKDTITKSISIAKKTEKEALIHNLLPWNWIIDICALIIRFPFIILRRAGSPSKIEENIIAYAIKIVFTIILVTWLTYKGITLSGINLIEVIKGILK